MTGSTFLPIQAPWIESFGSQREQRAENIAGGYQLSYQHFQKSLGHSLNVQFSISMLPNHFITPLPVLPAFGFQCLS